MAIHSYLTKGVRRTGEKIKSQNTDSSIKGNNQRDNDSEATSFTSSTHGSTSSATSSTDRSNSGMEGGIRRKKTLDKSNSKKRNGFGNFRLSRRRPKSPLSGLPDDGSVPTPEPSPSEVSNPSLDRLQKPVQKFTRSGSLRSLKILRSKNRQPSESKKSQDLHSKKSTFSSTLKDSKFSEHEESQMGVKEGEEVLSVGKLCPYHHCSLRGHHHHHEPPLERFAFLKRRSSNDQKSLNPQTQPTGKQTGKKTDVKVTKKVSNKGGKGKKDEKTDFSIEFYAKTRSEPFIEASFGCDDVDLADIMFGNQNEVQNLQMDHEGVKAIPGSKTEDAIFMNDGKDGSLHSFTHFEGKNMAFKNGNQMSMWQLIGHLLSGLVGEPESELDRQVDEEKQSCEGSDSHESEIQKMSAIKVAREGIEKIFLGEVQDNQSTTSEGEGIHIQATRNDKKELKLVLLKRFITELEKVKEYNPNKHKQIPLVTEPEAETVPLRRQTVGEKKNCDEWMLDYALQQVVSELAPTQKRKVALLVKAFESVSPRLE